MGRKKYWELMLFTEFICRKVGKFWKEGDGYKPRPTTFLT